jgi:putative ABC transport system permease protein
MQVGVLGGVFDPPPAALAVPWAYLTVVAGVAVLSVYAAARAAIAAAGRPGVAILREL